MPYALLVVVALLADPPCLPGAKLVKRGGVEQCVTPQGKLHGLVRVNSPTNGKVILEQRWENDQQDGPGHTWHDDGKMESESVYKAGQPDGAWKTWWPSGSSPANRSTGKGSACRHVDPLLRSRHAGLAADVWTGREAQVRGPLRRGRNTGTKEPQAPNLIARVMHDARPACASATRASCPRTRSWQATSGCTSRSAPPARSRARSWRSPRCTMARRSSACSRPWRRWSSPRRPTASAVPISYPFVFHGDPSQLPPPDEGE